MNMLCYRGLLHITEILNVCVCGCAHKYVFYDENVDKMFMREIEKFMTCFFSSNLGC